MSWMSRRSGGEGRGGSDRDDWSKIGQGARRVDASPELVSTAKLIRRLLPGDESYGDSLTTAGDRVPQRLGRQLSGLRAEEPSALRELGLGALQTWEALTERQRRRKGTADTAILFTDLVGFSDWALEAGDDAAVELLREVGTAEEEAISGHAGIVVKRLGDGAMAVFSRPEQAIWAAAESQRRLTGIKVSGHTPRQRAGVHLGRPRKVGEDYLGVDVNIAARVGDAAKADEILVSDPVRELLDPSAFRFGRRKKLKAPGTPEELAVCTAKPR